MWMFIKSSLWDYLLCVASAAALCFTACSGFYATQPYQDIQGILLIVGLSAAIMAVLFVVSYSVRTRIIGIPLVVLLFAAALALSCAASDVQPVLEDVAGNALYFAIVVEASAASVFVLSRWRTTVVVLLVASVLFSAALEYLYWYAHVGAFAVLLVSTTALFVYRTYQETLLRSDSERLAFGSTTLAGIALASFAVACALGIFAVFIAPLNPPHVAVKLITEHYRVEEKEVRGVGDTTNVPDNELVSFITSTVTAMSDDLNQEFNERNDDEAGEGDNEDAEGSSEEGASSIDGLDDGGRAGLSLLPMDWLLFLIIGLVLLVVIAAILLKKHLRVRRYKRMVAEGPNNAVENLYRFFLDRFAKLKIPMPNSLTLGEYARNYADTFSKFEGGVQPPRFSDLTDVYVRRSYGDEDVGEDELSSFKDYYHAFYRRALRYAGVRRYAWLFFRI